jgi:hypothetical protein
LTVCLIYNLETGKRVERFAEVWGTPQGGVIDSVLPKQLLLPTRLPQEWLPAGARTGASSPVRSWIDRSLFEGAGSDDPEGLSGVPDAAS